MGPDSPHLSPCAPVAASESVQKPCWERMLSSSSDETIAPSQAPYSTLLGVARADALPKEYSTWEAKYIRLSLITEMPVR